MIKKMVIAGLLFSGPCLAQTSELQAILDSLNGSPTATPEEKSDIDLINEEFEAQHQKSIERKEKRERQRREQELEKSRPTPDPFVERADKLIDELSSLKTKNAELLQQISRKQHDIARQKTEFENNVFRRKKHELLTNSDQKWIDNLIRSLEQKYATSSNTLSNYANNLKQNTQQLEDCLKTTKNLKKGISYDVAADRQKLTNCSAAINRIERSLPTLSSIDLESHYKSNLAAIDQTIKRRETEDRQKNMFNKK